MSVFFNKGLSLLAFFSYFCTIETYKGKILG